MSRVISSTVPRITCYNSPVRPFHSTCSCTSNDSSFSLLIADIAPYKRAYGKYAVLTICYAGAEYNYMAIGGITFNAIRHQPVIEYSANLAD